MKKGQIINGYRILKDFEIAGGMSKISFAEKSGKEFFIKEFLAPKYPTKDSPGSEKTKEKKKNECVEFEKRHRDLNNRISTKCSSGGNLVYAIDFFRDNTSYYKVTEKIDVSSLSAKSISALTKKEILIVLKSVVHSLRILHKEDIVHGDLKPDNILIKKAGSYTTKLIDFDDSYFSRKPSSERELVVGTPEYYSPELADYIKDEDEELSGDILTTKSDIFAIGVIFTEYLTGQKPLYDSKYNYTWSAVKNKETLSFKFSNKLTSTLEMMLRRMMVLDSTTRPDIDEIFKILREEDDTSFATEPTKHIEVASISDIKPSGLRGHGLKIAEGEKIIDKKDTSDEPVSKLKLNFK